MPAAGADCLRRYGRPRQPAPAPPKTDGADKASEALIVYFSCTGSTRAAAERIAAQTGGTLYEIVPADPYSAADLNYSDSGCCANREMNDPSARPAVAGAWPV